MNNQSFTLLVFTLFFLLSGISLEGYCQKVLPIGVGLNPTRTIPKKQRFLSKEQFYSKVELKKPMGWSVTRRDDKVIVARDGLWILTTPLKDLPLGVSEQEKEAIAKKRIQPTTYEITFHLESYSSKKFEETQQYNDNLKTQIHALKETHALATIPKDDEMGYFIATSKEEKNQLANYWVEKEQLEDLIKEMPEYYISGYGVTIERPSFLEMFPKSADVQIETFISEIQQILLQK